MHRLKFRTAIHRPAHGFTLIELLVGMAVGLIVLTAVVVSWGIAVRNNAYALSVTALNNDMRSFMHVVTRDVRRASNEFGAGGVVEETVFINDAGDCITFDANVLDIQETEEDPVPSGYRLSNQRFEMWFEQDASATYVAKEDRCASNERWVPLHVNGDRGISVTGFSIDTEESRCIELFDADVLNSDDPLPDFDFASGRCSDDAEDRVEVTVLRVSLEGSMRVAGDERTFSFDDSVRINNNKLFIRFN